MHQRQGNIEGIEESEREKTGIKGLKIKYNRVFGYYIEVTKSNSSLVPKDLYPQADLDQLRAVITQELKELESRVLTAQRKDDGLGECDFPRGAEIRFLTDRRASSRLRTPYQGWIFSVRLRLS